MLTLWKLFYLSMLQLWQNGWFGHGYNPVRNYVTMQIWRKHLLTLLFGFTLLHWICVCSCDEVNVFNFWWFYIVPKVNRDRVQKRSQFRKFVTDCLKMLKMLVTYLQLGPIIGAVFVIRLCLFHINSWLPEQYSNKLYKQLF